MKEEDYWFTLNEKGDVIEVDLNDEKGFNDYCYFCDFSETKPHQHHIIRKIDGGKDVSNNRLPLCANHHELVHKRIYLLGFSKGYYYLKNRKSGKIIYPTKRQMKKKRKLPFTSMNNSKYLLIKGDLNKKAIVIVRDLYRKQREKNLKKGVQ